MTPSIAGRRAGGPWRLEIACLAGFSRATPRMEPGASFWNPGWHKPGDRFQDVRNVTGDNPWNPRFPNEAGRPIIRLP